MRAFIVILMFLGWTAFVSHDVVCRMLGRCDDDASANSRSVNDMPRTSDLDFVMDDSVYLQGYEQFAFRELSAQPVINTNNESYLTEVLAILNAHPQANLTLTGYYLPSEKDTSVGILENIGLARANAIRQWFVARGMDENRIGLDSKMDNNALPRPILFTAKLPKQRPDEYDIDIKPAYTFTNMTFSDITFEYNSSVFEPNKAFELYMDSVKTYLELPDNTQKNVIIIGHTDNKGTPPYNIKLGLQRAKAAKKYIIEDIGITPEKIATDTKGQTEPIATNDTDEGREKNRRVNIRIE